MLGGFDLEYDGKNVVLEKNSSTKVNRLFQMLVLEPEGVPRNVLIQNLFTDDEGDTSNSFRALVFRLRKRMSASKIDGTEYIKIQKGIYHLDQTDIEIKCDALEFESLIKEAELSADEDRISLLEKACQMYRGEFLPNMSNIPWVVTYSVRFKNSYLKAVESLCAFYKEHKEYKKLYSISHITSEFYPFNEMQINEMEALISLNKKNEAIKLYEETEKMLFDELGVSMPERMVEMLSEVGKQIKHNADVISNVKKNLETFKEEESGAMFCTYPSFVDSYRLMKRVMRRTGQSAYLMLLTITDGKGYALNDGNRLNELSDEVFDAVSKSVRSGDIYTKYSDGQYLIFLLGLTQEDCNIVRDRILDNMEMPSRRKYLQCHISPVSSDISSEDELKAAFLHGARKR
jgi:DNA-binding SARP family transcriptional activator